jgi:uncharacterized DUF497 family protein
VVFTWDSGKAAANLKKHGVDFREAATVFDDPLSTTYPDVDHKPRFGRGVHRAGHGRPNY